MKKKSLTIFLLPLIIIALCSSTLVVYTQSKINDSKTQFNQSYYNNNILQPMSLLKIYTTLPI